MTIKAGVIYRGVKYPQGYIDRHKAVLDLMPDTGCLGDKLERAISSGMIPPPVEKPSSMRTK
jgi:hypothetical protein